MRSQNETPYYIRTVHGETFSVDSLEEALSEFLGVNGYRLTLTAGDKEVVIRRDQYDSVDSLGFEEAEATITNKTPKLDGEVSHMETEDGNLNTSNHPSNYQIPDGPPNLRVVK